MAEEFDINNRSEILKKYFGLQALYSKAVRSLDEEGGTVTSEFKSMNEEILKIAEQYKNGVPVRALSRCPFTGEELKHSFDSYGIDGLWWNSDYPIRPDEDLPVSYLGFTGALKVDENVIESFPFICTPGPDVPFVLPRLLFFNQVKAVMSSFKVGAHTAYLVFYYSYPPMTGLERPNEFGMGSYRYTDLNGDIKYGRYYDAIVDFELEEWIRDGKLLWIEPGDESLRLNGDVSRCPYLGLAGSKTNKYISDGKIWRDSDGTNAAGTTAAKEAVITRESLEKAERFVEERGGVI